MLTGLLWLTLISGCTTIHKPDEAAVGLTQNAGERLNQLAQLKSWTIQGKIAFLQQDKRERASLNWQYQEEPLNQRLNLTTYLGINVLHLESKNNWHIVEVDGQEYQSDDLEYLILSLTGLTLPAQALTQNIGTRRL